MKESSVNVSAEGSLHKQSKHEIIGYCCDKCNYEATLQNHLTNHNQNKHEGVIYSCNQCEYNSTQQHKLIYNKQLIDKEIYMTVNSVIIKPRNKVS